VVRCGCVDIRDWTARRVVGLVGDVGKDIDGGREVRRPPTGSLGADRCRECVERDMTWREQARARRSEIGSNFIISKL
jgi:hypothetical protein